MKVSKQNEKISISQYNETDYKSFTQMFYEYFSGDLETGDSYEVIKKEVVDKQVLPFFKSGAVLIDIAKMQGKAIGFIIYQVDSVNSDWCERPGWGFIREFYIDKNYRNKGIGGNLLARAENSLKKLGATIVYLTTDIKDYVKVFYKNNGYLSENTLSARNAEYLYKNL